MGGVGVDLFSGVEDAFCDALGDGLFVRLVDVGGIFPAEIFGDDEECIGGGLDGFGLGLAELWPELADGFFAADFGELDDEEREFGVFERGAPAGDEIGEHFGVLRDVADFGVGLTLVPDDAGEGEVVEGFDAALEEEGGAVGVLDARGFVGAFAFPGGEFFIFDPVVAGHALVEGVGVEEAGRHPSFHA